MPRAWFLSFDADLNVEDSLEKAERFMEPIDVERGGYEVVYDETGAAYTPRVDGARTRLLPTEETHYEDLVSRLRVLLSRAQPRGRYCRNQAWPGGPDVSYLRVHGQGR